jgi:L-rhamnose mutarotase
MMNRQVCLQAIGSFVVLACATLCAADSKSNAAADGKVKRVGMVVGIKPEMIEKYKRLHAAENAGVRDLLKKYHMNNFSIYLQKMPDGKWYEFGYYEYSGDDFDGDMANLAKEPRNIEWLKKCDPMQIPLPGAKGWTEMESVYLNP